MHLAFRFLQYVIFAAAITPSSLCAAQMSSLAHFGRLFVQDSDRVFWYKSPCPLGAEGFDLHPLQRRFYLLATLENRSFNRLRVSRVRNSQFVIDATGREWKHFPKMLTFRVTATAIGNELTGLDTDEITESGDMNSFLRGLQFRLKDYQGLHLKILPPAAVKMIGMPANVKSPERVFRVSFDTPDIPVEDRLVLEVLSPGGQLITRFHLELL
jgi:hypothetical protein